MAGEGTRMRAGTRESDGSEEGVETFVIPNPRRVAVIESEVDISRSPEDVFDYCSDPANEPQWNVKMTRIEKLSEGPLGVGTLCDVESASPSIVRHPRGR
jgi:hypothetical protein